MRPALRACLILALILAAGRSGETQQEPAAPASPGATFREWNEQILETGRSKSNDLANVRQEYRIGAEDLIEISVFEIPELSRSVRVSASGEISLPLIGTVPAAGLSPLELEQSLTKKLRDNYVRDPQVSVFLKEYRSDPVSVVGAVKIPGLYQIQTQKSLVEVLAMAQGFSESPRMLPGRTIVITRKQPREKSPGERGNAQSQDRAGETSSRSAEETNWAEIVEVPIKELLQSGDPKWNARIYPGDVIKVVPAGTFYVAGEVNHPGGFPLTDFDYVSAIQALAMAGGTKRTANLKNAVIIRQDAAGNRLEETLDLKDVFQGKVADVKLGANDILLVPGSAGKAAALRALEATVQIGTGLLIWRVP